MGSALWLRIVFASVRFGLCVFLASCGLALSGASPAHAWVEQSVRSYHVHLNLESSGAIEIRHELVLGLRGGPLKVLEIEGIGEPGELLPDAVVSRATSADSGGYPLLLERTEGDALRLSVAKEDGLRGGTYRFTFAYRKDALESGLLRADGERLLLTWVGPRLSSGIDSARVTVALPHAPLAPELPRTPDAAARGVLLGQVLRGPSRDEVELLRTHVAVGEPAVWQIAVDPRVLAERGSALEGHASALTGSALSPGPSARLGVESEEVARAGWALASFVLFFVSLLVRQRALAVLSERRQARTRPLVPGRGLLRALFGGLGAAGFTWAVEQHRIGWALAGAGVALILGVELLPVRRVAPRGPGAWQPLSLAQSSREAWPWSVRVLDLGSLPGFTVFLGLVSSHLYFAHRTLAEDQFTALMIVVHGLLWTPLFLTGRSADFPEPPAVQAKPWLRLLERARLRGVLTVESWCRVPLGSGSGASCTDLADEVRLRLVLKEPPSGLRALEVAFEEGPGAFVSPCVLLRVVEGSTAEERLPLGLSWQRGPGPEEKVTVIHPRAPTKGHLLRLVTSVLAHLTHTAGTRGAPSQTRARSEGRGERTEKALTSVPA